MPTYELPIIIRVMKKPETASTLKRIANTIFDKGGVIRKIENLGEQPLPLKMSAHEKRHTQGSYFLFHFDIPPRNIHNLMDEFNRDVDVIRNRVYKKPDGESQECTWHEEMLPPPYRPAVQDLMKISEETYKKKTKKFQFNTGLNYYPFQR